MENIRMHKDIRIVKKDKRESYFISGPNYHTVK